MKSTQKAGANEGCECAKTAATGRPDEQQTIQEAPSEVKLENLIPIAVVIAAGCEPCAKLMVGRAWEQGSSKRQIRKVLALVAHMQRLDCLTKAVGTEVIDRMTKPLAMARRTLEEMKPASQMGYSLIERS